MTLVTHILHSEFQFIALDGMISPGEIQNFKKNITYSNGLIYFLNEYENREGLRIYDLINGIIMEGSSIENFDNLTTCLYENVIKDNNFLETGIAICASIEKKQYFKILFKDYEKKYEPDYLFLSKPNFRPLFKVMDIASLTYESLKLTKLVDCFYDDAIKDKSYDGTFNNNLNIIGINKEGFTEILRSCNKITAFE